MRKAIECGISSSSVCSDDIEQWNEEADTESLGVDTGVYPYVLDDVGDRRLRRTRG
jgi:hypothetical protein